MAVNTQTHIEPYTGPRPFGRSDQYRFFGRDSEADRICMLTLAHPVVLIYATASAGKTSLLNAQVIPRLEQERCEVLPTARVYLPLPDGIGYEQIKNIYIFNTLLSWERDNPKPLELASLTLTEYLKRRIGTEDQDEDYLDYRVPQIVIFDQLEELFTAYPDRWQDRKEFFEQIIEALDDNTLKPILRILLSVREDSLGDIESYASTFPGQLRARVRLERLREQAALLAVTEPVKIAGHDFEPGAAERLVDGLVEYFTGKTASGEIVPVKGQFVDTMQLQIVCQNLWRSLSPEELVITHARVQQSGDVETALEEFYDQSLLQIRQQTGVKEGLLRRWFEREIITQEGTRGVVIKGAEKTGGVDNQAIEMLVNLNLIRAEWRGGTVWYELINDRFIDVIWESNKRWNLNNDQERLRNDLEAKAERWVQQSRNPSYLLSQGELKDAEQWRNSSDVDKADISEAVISLIEASHNAHRKQSLRRVQYVLSALATLVALLSLATFYVYKERQAAVKAGENERTHRERAEEARKDALKAAALAEKNRALAEDQTLIAEQALDTANAAKEEAEQQRGIAVAQKKQAQTIAQQNIALTKQAQKNAQENFMLARDAEAQRSLAEEQKRQAEEERKRADDNFKQLQSQTVVTEEFKRVAEQSESNYWDIIESQSNSELYFEYIKKYPKGKHVSDAKKRIGASIPEVPPNLGVVIGKLEDNNVPIVGATVTAIDASGRLTTPVLTNTRGGYTLYLEPGSYTLQVIAQGYKSDTRRVKVKAGEREVITGFFLSR